MADDPFHIGEVAARTGLSLRTVRHWESVGLIRPSGRTEGGFRLYTDADVERVLLLRAMKPAEFALEALQEIGDLRDHLLALPPEQRADDPATDRLRELVEIIRLRFKLQRERLAAGELALQSLRMLLPETMREPGPTEPAPEALDAVGIGDDRRR
jgi:DNA-binding transcriptional MerR regulator